MRLLSTKMLDYSLKERILALGFSLIEFPFIAIEPLSLSEIELKGSTVIFSSQNAVEQAFRHKKLGAQIQIKKCVCVGSKTQLLLEQYNIQVQSCAQTADDLVQYFNPEETYSFICGKRRLPKIEKALATLQRPCQIIEVYDTHLTPKTIQTTIDGLLFFSPSAVESYFSVPQNTTGPAFCLGPSTHTTYQKFGSHGILSIAPNATGMLGTIHQYFKNL